MRHARGGELGPKAENRAAGARFRRTMHGGVRICVGRVCFERGKVGLGCCEAGIMRRARGGELGPKQQKNPKISP
jgi:hypothetical protein